MFLKIGSALQMESVIVSLSRTVSLEQKRGLGPRRTENLQNLHKEDPNRAHQASRTEGMRSDRHQDRLIARNS